LEPFFACIVSPSRFPGNVMMMTMMSLAQKNFGATLTSKRRVNVSLLTRFEYTRRFAGT
jgi:hypothetical protein